MHATVRSVIEAAAEREEEICILDTEASPEHLSRGTARYADALLAVVEPYYKSLETGRRMAVLAQDLGLEQVELVANKIRDDSDLAAVREFSEREGLGIAGVVPFAEEFAGLTGQGHGECDDDCWCHESPEEAARCLEERLEHVR